MGIGPLLPLLKRLGKPDQAASTAVANDKSLFEVLKGVLTQANAVKAKTDNLPAVPASQGDVQAVAAYVDTEVAAIKAKTDNLPATPASQGDVTSARDSVKGGDSRDLTQLYNLVDTLEVELAAVKAFVDTEVAAIKAKTDNLPATPASQGDVSAVAAYVDTEVAAILAAVDTEVAAIKAKTDNLPANPAAGIRSIQRGSGSFTNATSATFNLGTVLADASKASVRILYNVNDASAIPHATYGGVAQFSSLTTTQITFAKPVGSGGVTTYVGWEIVEYY